MGQLAFTFFTFTFPAVVVAFIVKQTTNARIGTRQKKANNGNARWPEGGIDMSTMYSLFGIVLALGLVKLPAMEDHWDVSKFHDFELLRSCMIRDMFALIYCRFFHMAPGGGPKRRRDDTLSAIWYHIRFL
ncbi:unnamed protein product [Pylaiella littoralis]